MKKYEQFDRKKLKVGPLRERKNQLDVATRPEAVELSAEARAVVEETAGRIRRARELGRPVIMAFGAHAIKNGLGSVLIALMERGWVTHLATNGAGIIHDWEFAFQGKSGEDVRRNVATGTFGLWEETGRFINLALCVGAYSGRGYGEAVGAMIHDDGLAFPEIVAATSPSPSLNTFDGDGDVAATMGALADLRDTMRRFTIAPGWMKIEHPSKQYSVQAAAYRLGIPFTGHPMFGHDIIYEHPMCCGAAIGRVAERDFLRFAASVRNLEDGVYLSVGSAVMSPMIFEKSFSMAQNVHIQAGTKITRHFIAVVDLAGASWDWSQGEPPPDNPAYYLRYCKTFSRMGGTLRTCSADNRAFLPALLNALR